MLTFNRTNLELKLFAQIGEDMKLMAFNRTNLELKLWNVKARGFGCKLLIAPIWN